MLSSDVSAGVDPLFVSVNDKKNAAYLGNGIVFNKYTGARGKSGSNDANPEYFAKIRNVMDQNGIHFQTAELGKVDQGGGGTIAYILGNYDMNPKRCLSYITQKKGDLEEEEEKVLKENKKVFGCDICQDICPHNKNIPITSIERFKQDTILKLDAEEINDISNKEFKRRYGNRAFSWRGKNIIKRNINIVSEKPNE